MRECPSNIYPHTFTPPLHPIALSSLPEPIALNIISQGNGRFKPMKQISEMEEKTVHVVFKYLSMDQKPAIYCREVERLPLPLAYFTADLWIFNLKTT
jgi:hypothetical protein